MPFSRSTKASRPALSEAQSKPRVSTSKPYSRASCSALPSSAAFHMIFFGTQPTFTQVPPRRPDSASTTLAPYSAARWAAASPPLPPPITTRSSFSVMTALAATGGHPTAMLSKCAPGSRRRRGPREIAHLAERCELIDGGGRNFVGWVTGVPAKLRIFPAWWGALYNGGRAKRRGVHGQSVAGSGCAAAVHVHSAGARGAGSARATRRQPRTHR